MENEKTSGWNDISKSLAKQALLSVRDLLIDRLKNEKYHEALQIANALRILVDVKSEELQIMGFPPLS